jgi:hypothetical protein
LTAKKQELKKKLVFSATASAASTLIATGPIKETTKQLAAGVNTKIKAKLKPKKFKQLAGTLDSKGKAKAKVTATATDQGGNTATDTVKVKLKA